MLQVPYILRRTSSSSILQLRLNTQFVWESYFSSLHKIIMTTFKVHIISQQGYHSTGNNGHLYCHYRLLVIVLKFNLIIYGTRPLIQCTSILTSAPIPVTTHIMKCGHMVGRSLALQTVSMPPHSTLSFLPSSLPPLVLVERPPGTPHLS